MDFDTLQERVTIDGRKLSAFRDTEIAAARMYAGELRVLLRDVYESAYATGVEHGQKLKQSELSMLIAASPIDQLTDATKGGA